MDQIEGNALVLVVERMVRISKDCLFIILTSKSVLGNQFKTIYENYKEILRLKLSVYINLTLVWFYLAGNCIKTL